jgi:hypothetical protein
MVRTDPNEFSRSLDLYVSYNILINNQSEMVQAWNSKMGAASKQLELMEPLIPHDRKEMALAMFHENDYKINGKRCQVQTIKHLVQLWILSQYAYCDVQYAYCRNF